MAEGVTTDASNAFLLRGSPLLLAMQTSAGLLSSADGKVWMPANDASCQGAHFDWPLVPAPGGLRNFGELTHIDPTKNYTSFSAGGASVLQPSGSAPSGVSCVAAPLNISVSGLPRAISCDPKAPRGAFGCPFRLNPGGDVLALPDGSLLLSALVYWGGAPPASAPGATSVVALRSTSGGAEWTYAGTIADAAAYPGSKEGPNESALALLADGATVAAVVRLDAGDGQPSHPPGPFSPYALATSADGGRSWVPRGLLGGAGCARPRLLAAGSGGPLLLSGGRWQVAGSSGPPDADDGGWDPRMWVNAAGDAGDFGPFLSISYWHNALVGNASWRFTPEVNASHSPRQSQAYTSLVALDGGAPPSARTRRLAITYNVGLPPNSRLFLMPFTLTW